MTEEEIKRLAKRITMLIRELEVTSLDLVLYSKPMAEGRFPKTHITIVANELEKYANELRRVKEVWEDYANSLPNPEPIEKKKK